MASNVINISHELRKCTVDVKWVIRDFEKWIEQCSDGDSFVGPSIELPGTGDLVKPTLSYIHDRLFPAVNYINEQEKDQCKNCSFSAKVYKSNKVLTSLEGIVLKKENLHPREFPEITLFCGSDLVLENGALTIHLSISQEWWVTSRDDEYEGQALKERLQFAHAAAKNGELSDFQLISGSAVFKCHRIYLAQSSEVFRKLFHYEPQKTEADLSAHSASDVEKLLEFVYTNNLEDEESFNSTSLLRLSDEYDVVGLRVRCEKSFASKLTPENALEMKSLAQEVYAPFLLKKAEAFLN